MDGWVGPVVCKNSVSAIVLWVYENPCYFSASKVESSLTGEFEDCEGEIVAWLAEDLIPFVQQAAAETLIHVFERGLFDGLLAVGGKFD